MFGLFEGNIYKTKKILEESGFIIIEENKKPSVYNTDDNVVTQRYRKDNKIVYILYKVSNNDNEYKSIIIDLEVLDGYGNTEIIKRNIEDCSDIMSFINADDNMINDMIECTKIRKVNAMKSFMKSIR